MTSIHPKISVLMPNYNAGPYLRQAIESILGQTFTDFEFIIIDDGSSDNSRNIIEEYAKKDTRIIAVKNEENMKICKTLNKGIDLAKGEYIARMDSDDIARIDRFEKQITFLEEHTHIGVCGSNIILIDQLGKEQGIKIMPETHASIINAIRYRNPLCHPTIMIRNILLGKNRYDPDVVYAEDLDLRIRLSQSTECYNIQETLLYYRVGENYSTVKKQKEMIQKTLEVRRRAIYLGYKPGFFGYVSYMIARCMQRIPPKIVLWIFNTLIGK